MLILNSSTMFLVALCILSTIEASIFGQGGPVGYNSVPEFSSLVSNSFAPVNFVAYAFPKTVVMQSPIPQSVIPGSLLTTTMRSRIEPLPAAPVSALEFGNSIPLPFAPTPKIPLPFQSMIQGQSATASTPTSNALPFLVESFASYAIQALESDPKLKRAFAIERLTADEQSRIVFDMVFNDHKRSKAMNPEASAKMVAEAHRLNSQHLTAESLIRLFAYSIGRHMFLNGILTPENVLSFSEKFVGKIRDIVSSEINSSPEEDFRTVARGFMNFLTSIGLYRQDNAAEFAALYVRELNSLQA